METAAAASDHPRAPARLRFAPAVTHARRAGGKFGRTRGTTTAGSWQSSSALTYICCWIKGM